MAEVKISNLPAATTVSNLDIFPIVSGGATKSLSVGVLLTSASNVTNAKLSFGVKGDGVRFSTATITSASHTLVVTGAAFTSTDVGKPIVVVGAGSSSGSAFYDLCTTISAVTNSTTVTLTAAAGTSVSAADVYYGTDDTTSIQNAINTVGSGTGGTLYFPRGIYMIGGPIQTTGNCQVYLTNSNWYGVSIPLTIVGDPGQSVPNQFLRESFPVCGTIFMSAINVVNASGEVGSPAIIGSSLDHGGLDFLQIALVITNITIRRPENSGVTCLDLSRMATCELTNLFCDHTCPVESLHQPSQVSMGIRTPNNGNEARVILNNCYVSGCYFGLELGEHADASNCWVQSCFVGERFRASDHPVSIRHHILVACPYGLNWVESGASSVEGSIAIEISGTTPQLYPAWMNNIYTINDGNGYARGHIRYTSVVSGVGRDDTAITTNSPSTKVHMVPWDEVNPALNPAKVTTLAAAPSIHAEGWIYFNTVDKHFYGYNGTAWVQLDN